MKGQYHKVVGFMETSEDSGSSAPKAKENDLANTKEEFNSVHADNTVGTDTHTTRKGEIDNRLDDAQVGADHATVTCGAEGPAPHAQNLPF